MDWISPVSGLVGALVGAAASYLGTHRAQAKALADARQARLEAKQDTAVATLADTFGKLQRHVRDVPGDRERGLDAEESTAFTATRQAWDQKLEDLTAPARIAVGVIRDEALRERLYQTLDLLDGWQSGLEYAYRGGARSRAWVLRGILSHAVECVGAWQREEPLPESNHAYSDAVESLELKREEHELTAQAEASYRREQRAQLASGVTEPTSPAAE
ncbi:hypothetical protein [Streptomyces canus]|uniref:hypothetical protein n=1 Tax=Streptomyces canus TaxID=58343 RepID=UPI002DDC28E1|nr:hypothetical protein [Streptomyces canus]WSD89116.1 hypothetical protein OG925_34705 [Streptomyces canus]